MRSWPARVALVSAIVLCAGAQGAAGATSIWRENHRPGRWGWILRHASRRHLEAYGSQVSVVAGQTVDLHVSTVPAGRYRIEVFRLGWYGGAGARLVECQPGCAGQPGARAGPGQDRRLLRGRARPVPPGDPATGELALRWPVTDRIRTHRSWVTGEYLAQVVLASGPQRSRATWVPFIVRPARPSPGAIVVVIPVNTWEAYNNWGGKSLYTFNSTGGQAAVKVSFDRPWARDEENVSFPVAFEYRYIQFLERGGFPLAYATDVDVDRRPDLLLGHPLAMAIGHGEYWSGAIRDAWDAARDAGENLAFLGANIGFWQIRYEDRRRTIVEYRESSLDPDPNAAEKTTFFRELDPPRPECELEGVQFQYGGLDPPLVNDYVVTAAANPWLTEAGLKPGDVLAGAVRGEWDAVEPRCHAPAPTVLFHYGGADPADATLTTTPAGGRVLALGSEGFGRLVSGFRKPHCSVDARAEVFLRAAIRDLGEVASLPPMPAGCVRPRR
jgi:N,N-dimethylformamidase beta subunit-like, C-terminal